jgi:homoserine dehydrogenase
VKEALNLGKHVVTANKGPAAFAYSEINDLASKHNSTFLCESAVMDGAPVLNMAKTALKGTRILEISGILNSTTNFVLSQMEQGVSGEEAVKIAQQQGFAESDPRNDLDGWDAAAKIAVLANILMDVSMTPFDVERESIFELDPAFVRKTAQENKHLKIVCSVVNNSDSVKASVKLQALSLDHPFSRVKGSGSIIRLETDLMGAILITQEAPTLNDTAYGVLNDLITIAGRDR